MWDNIKRIDDEAENVCKFVYTNASAVVESVLYKYPTYQERTVICCSTQSGCPVGCRFCGAGDYFVRNLTAEEIVSQAVYSVEIAEKAEGIKAADMGRLQIMFMSMGEPLLNLKALVPALRELYKLYPNAALLISTSAPDIDYSIVNKISQEIPTIGLQFSVHESTNEARDALVPFKKKLTLEQIAEKGVEWYQETDRNPFFNYCAHDQNSSQEDADRIRSLYSPVIWFATVSVICERDEGMPKTNEHQRGLASDFASKLVELGYDTRMFDPAGQDTIGGGCGQLWFVQEWMHQHPDLARPSIGHGKQIVHTPVAA